MDWNEELMSVVRPEPERNVLTPWMQEKAPVIGKWMTFYFWMIFVNLIPSTIAVVEEMNHSGTIIGVMLGWVCAAVMIFAQFQMGRYQDRLKLCAGLNTVLLVGGIVVELVGSEPLSELWGIPSVIISLVVLYQFMHGCGDLLVGVDNEQSDKWYRLWKWYIWLMVGGIVGVPVLMVIAFMLEDFGVMGLLIVGVVLAWAVLILAQAVREVVYIYRTAKTFRRIAENL